jgi:recombination protein RecA
MRAETLSSLRSSLERMSARGSEPSERVLSLGMPAIDAALPLQGLPYGSVTELQVRGTSGAATSFALCACRAAQQQAAAAGTPRAPSSAGTGGATSPWCAFIDPAATLYAPGVARLGVDLDHLLVVRPELEAVGRAALRIVEANLASVLVIDLTGVELSLDEHVWERNVRRLALAVKSAATSILLLTRAEQFQTLPLPTSMRLEFTRRSTESFELRVAKERTGRISPSRSIPYSIFDPAAARVEPFSAVSAHAGSALAVVRRVS